MAYSQKSKTLLKLHTLDASHGVGGKQFKKKKIFGEQILDLSGFNFRQITLPLDNVLEEHISGGMNGILFIYWQPSTH